MSDPRKETVRSAYDRMGLRYLAWGRAVGADPRDRMTAAFMRLLPEGARVLDLGCGAGVPSTRQLARRFQVVGVDISASQIALARSNIPDAEFIHADLAELDLPDSSFDGVVALYAISHVPREEHARLFADVARWLEPRGLFLATLGSADSPDWTGEWLGEEMFFSSFDADENRRLLREAGFALLVDEVAVTQEPDGDAEFLWVLASTGTAADTPEDPPELLRPIIGPGGIAVS